MIMIFRILLFLFAIVIFVSCTYLGYELLDSNKISGANFVVLIIAFAVIGLVISFSSEVQEFSVAGNIVKLKEVKEDVIKSINELKSTRIATFNFLLSLSKRLPGGWADPSIIDSRLSDFWFLYNQIIKSECENELKNDIKKTVDILLKGQLSNIAEYSDNILEKYNKNGITPKPKELYINALEDESIKKAAARNKCGGSIDKINESLVDGLNEYRKLYELSKIYIK